MKHPNLGGLGPAQKAARRDEEALQLLLHLHVLALAPPAAGMGARMTLLYTITYRVFKI